ncbi:hypothetical protein OVA24_20245 [Luteolibacter sp. SL250]|uniref:hypothetical protein n=1 Tax=Luteolibacter sp. SL250 TaxID=2995170 RepID=UPI00227171DC|nr:hypothetical protein [Luteolibacter sp. SL250]WAC19558.1 hypothetical protein OVA24_20245 [Luteolibacter sp. SL250]
MSEKGKDISVSLADFSLALARLQETETRYCVVGGLAVGQWAEILLPPSLRKEFPLPVRSKDIDLRAEKSDAMMFVRNLKDAGAKPGIVIKRIPKDGERSFPSIAVPLTLPATSSIGGDTPTTIEALSGLPLLDEPGPFGTILHHGTPLRYGDIYLLDPCSLLVCKLNALHTRPPGESENDKIHARILSFVIPRFISKALRRYKDGKDSYHPGKDASRLASFLRKDPWQGLIPEEERRRVLESVPPG